MNAVAKIEPRDLTPIGEVQREITRMGGQLKSVLPSHIDIAKFQRVAMTAITMDPDLLNADRASLFTALTKAATDGLLPDKREGALTIANTKVKRDGREEYVKMVVWMPMVAGIVKKVRQSGEVTRMIAKAVYEKDEFDVLFGDADRIFHRPFRDGHPGKIVGAYSIVHLKDGSISRDFMPKWRIDKAKAVAKTKYVWEAWEDEMSIKTVIRHHAKLLPQSTDIEATFERDDTTQYDTTAAMLTGPQEPPHPLTTAALLEQASDDGDTDHPSPATGLPSGAGEPLHDAGQPEAASMDSEKLVRCLEAINAVKTLAGLGDIRTRDAAVYRALDKPEQLTIRAAIAAREAELTPDEVDAETGEVA